MSQEFKLKFDEMKGNHADQAGNDENRQLYGTSGNVRNLIFLWPDGRRQSFNYSYLVTHHFYPDENLINIEFTTHKVVIKGYGLEQLFIQLFEQRVRLIECIDQRYNDTVAGNLIVNEIIVVDD